MARRRNRDSTGHWVDLGANARIDLPTLGASAIKCCYAATGIPGSSALTQKVQCANTNMIFSDVEKTIFDEKISLNVNLPLVNPACWAGVLTSRPNFNAR